MKVNVKETAKQALEYLEDMGILIWEMDNDFDSLSDEDKKDKLIKIRLCYKVCASKLKELTK